jgi:hypothetical protein
MDNQRAVRQGHWQLALQQVMSATAYVLGFDIGPFVSHDVAN